MSSGLGISLAMGPAAATMAKTAERMTVENCILLVLVFVVSVKDVSMDRLGILSVAQNLLKGCVIGSDAKNYCACG